MAQPRIINPDDETGLGLRNQTVPGSGFAAIGPVSAPPQIVAAGGPAATAADGFASLRRGGVQPPTPTAAAPAEKSFFGRIADALPDMSPTGLAGTFGVPPQLIAAGGPSLSSAPVQSQPAATTSPSAGLIPDASGNLVAPMTGPTSLTPRTPGNDLGTQVQNFSSALSTVPKDLPAGLRDGAVYKTRDRAGNLTYSGSNVTGDSPIVNGSGLTTGRLPAGGSVPGLDPAVMARAAQLPGPGQQPSQSFGDGGITLGQSAGGFGGPRPGATDPFAGFGKSTLEMSRLPPQTRHDIIVSNNQQAGEDRRAGLRDTGDTSRALIGAETSRYGADSAARASLMGHQMSAATARLQGARDQMNKDREFGFNERKFGAEQGLRQSELSLSEQSAREKSSKNLQEEIAGMLPAGQDGKADTTNAARYAAGFNNVLGHLSRSLPPEQQAAIAQRGAGALDARDKQRIIAGMQLADVANATATGSLTPWGTRAISSNDPILGLRKLPNGDYQTNRVGTNGETEIIPGRYIEKEGSTFGFGGKASNKFTPLLEK